LPTPAYYWFFTFVESHKHHGFGLAMDIVPALFVVNVLLALLLITGTSFLQLVNTKMVNIAAKIELIE
jgi:hypothetical protein